MEEKIKQMEERLKSVESRHEKELDELKRALAEITNEVRKIQWKIALATGGGVGVVSFIDHILAAKGLK